MPKPLSPAIALRNAQIFVNRINGFSGVEIGVATDTIGVLATKCRLRSRARVIMKLKVRPLTKRESNDP